ncbi:MAG: hypothetical protein QXG39_02130 [Candidatus Aenigmatarchaeota archaeon]
MASPFLPSLWTYYYKFNLKLMPDERLLQLKREFENARSLYGDREDIVKALEKINIEINRRGL